MLNRASADFFSPILLSANNLALLTTLRPIRYCAMFRRTRERFERLEKMLEELTRAITAPPPAAPEGPNATAIIAEAFGKMAGNQTDLFASMSDLAMKSAARRMGIRGGTKRALTAERRADGKFAVKRLRDDRGRRCPLCVNPMERNVSIPMIQEHRQHEQQQQPDYRESAYPEEPAHDQSEPSGSGAYQNGTAPA
jgi:hypothetical protein